MTRGLTERPFDLRGKVAVITGGNGGLGLGFARGIAKCGGDVAIWARNEQKSAAAKAELERFGVNVWTRIVNVQEEAEVITAFDALLEESGRVDTVIANSGITQRVDSILDLPTEQYHELLAINQHGAFFTLREGARRMKARAEAGEPGGALIFCGSLSMFNGLPGMSHYAMAKGAVHALIRSLAVELGPYGIRANTIVPGYVKTGFSDAADPDMERAINEMMSAKAPLARIGYPDDFEGVAAFLSSDASSFQTGQVIALDGGRLVKS